MRPSDLDVWLYGIRVATLSEVRSRKLQLTYSDEAAEVYRNGQPILSVSMPLTSRRRYSHGSVGPWMEGLLPEGEARTTIEKSFGIPRGDTFELLRAVGRDCAGAVVFQPAGDPPPKEPGPPSVRPLSLSQIADELAGLGQRPLGADEHVRVSLTGQQPKLLVARTADGGWGRPADGAPSTHIFKPQDERLPGMARNEAACVTAGGRLGLGAIAAEVVVIAGRDVLAVTRYDRVISGEDGSVRRLHQEDLCQALGLPADDEIKYQHSPVHPPRLADAAGLLDTWAADGQHAMLSLARAMTFNVAIGNADAHAKNLSFVHLPTGEIALAPLYDVASTIQYPTIDGRDGPRPVSRDLALWVGSARHLDDVTIDDLIAEARSWGLTSRFVSDGIEGLLHAIPDVVERSVAQVGADARIAETVRARVDALVGHEAAGVQDPTVPGHRAAVEGYEARRNRHDP